MPRQRYFYRKTDYQHRNVHDDPLKKILLSTNEAVKGKELVPKNPRLMIDEGFYDKGNQPRDAKTSMGGLELFRKWFSQRNHDTPLRNFWELALGS